MRHEHYNAILVEIHYLPCIQYCSKFFGFERVILEQYEHYNKGSYRNRCHIAGVNGQLRLTIPLRKGKNEQLPLREVKIAYEEPWQRQHWESIRSAYGNAPFFDFYADELSVFYQKKYSFLFDFNLELLEWALGQLPGAAPLEYSGHYQKEPEKEVLDFRNAISPKAHRQKTDKHFQIINYPQVFQEKNGFLPNLSILDMLFCTGPQASLILEQSIAKNVI